MNTLIKFALSVSFILFISSLSYAQKIEHGQKFRALVIGIDGMKGVQFYESYLRNIAPHLKAIMDKGTYASCTSINDPHCAKTHYGPRLDPHYSWVTSPGWATVLTGVNTDKHLIKENDFNSQKIFFETTQQFPTFLKQLKQHGYITAAAGVGAFTSSINSHANKSHLSAGIVDYECGIDEQNKISLIPTNASSSCNADYRKSFNGDDSLRDKKLSRWLLSQINNENNSADIIMGVFDTIDGAGHKYGFDSNTGYFQAITRIDNYIGNLTQTIEQRVKNTNEAWLIIITSDHGGHLNPDQKGGHKNIMLHDEVIPFVVAIYSQNIHTIKQGSMDAIHVTQMDVSPSVLHWFDIQPTMTDGYVRSQYIYE